MRFEPYAYQAAAIRWMRERERCALWLDMGLGKTVCALTAIQSLQSAFECGPALVVAPLSVARNTWAAERDKWDHLATMRVALALGTERRRLDALAEPSDVVVINRENVEWLCARLGGSLWPRFSMVVLDESSSFKSHSAKRTKALIRACARVPRVVELTGTPAPNGYADLWAQFAILDGGERLGRTWTGFLARWFHPLWGNGRITYKYGINKGAEEEMRRRVSDITLSMRAADYLELPPAFVIDRPVALSAVEAADYRRLRDDYILGLGDGEVTAQTAAALSGKLHQVTGGAVYGEGGMVLQVSTAKADALAELVEEAVASGEGALVFYQYRHELPRLMERLRAFKPLAFDGQPDILTRWNAREVRVLLAHPASVSYGLNMQAGGSVVVWYSLTFNLEQYEQANARLHRQGQSRPVRIYRLLVPGTVDGTIAEALSGKADVQGRLLEDLKLHLRNDMDNPSKSLA